MFPLLMAGQIMHPSNGMFSVCMCKHLQNVLKLGYKVNMIIKVTKKQGICFKDLCYKLLSLFTHKYVNILRTVLIIESM
jgi:hypothetical protein